MPPTPAARRAALEGTPILLLYPPNLLEVDFARLAELVESWLQDQSGLWQVRRQP